MKNQMHPYSVLDGLEDGVQIIDSKLRYVYLNKKLLGEIKMQSQDIVGHLMVDKFPGIDQTEVYKEIHHCLKKGGVRKFLNEFKFPDGKQTFYEIKIEPVDVGVIIFSRDITNTKKGEELLKETNKELEHFAFLSAHSLREPLKLIATFSDLLINEYAQNLSQDGLKISKTIMDKANVSLQLINDLRDLSGIGRSPLLREDFSITKLAKEVLKSLSEEANQKKIKIRLAENELMVSAYPSLVAILLKNLLKNAIQFGEKEIGIFMDQTKKNVFCISNRIASQTVLNDVFHAFLPEGGKDHAGLGIAICKKVIRQHGGKIESVQEGDVFKVFFTLRPVVIN